MRQALARWTEPLVARLPDLRELPLRRQATIAIVASALLHFVLLCLAALFLAISPDPVEFAKARPKAAPLEIELLPPPPPPHEPKSVFPLSEPEPLPVIDSTGLAKADQPPAKATFESDQNMVAASEKPGTGDIPLPSIEGRTDRPTPNFTTQRAEVGAPEQPPAPTVAMSAPPIPQTAPPPLPQRPIFQPQPISAANDPAPATPAPAPPPEPVATPRPLKPVAEPRSDEIAFRQAPPIPPPTRPSPVAKLEPAPATPAPPIMPPTRPEPLPEMAKLVTPAPPKPPPSKSGYQAQQEKTKIEGNISNRGKAAVDAVRTPLGVYQRQISQAVGSRWNYYVKSRMDVFTVGETRVTFYVTKLGRVEDVRVVDNTANESFAQMCQRAVMEAELTPPPDGLLDAMSDGRLEITFNFNLYSN